MKLKFVSKSFPDHQGIPGHQGGSLPRSGSNNKPHGYAGLVKTVQNPVVPGGWVSLYKADKAGLDAFAGNWATVCETHGQIINHKSKKRALSWLPYPQEWCSECMELT